MNSNGTHRLTRKPLPDPTLETDLPVTEAPRGIFPEDRLYHEHGHSYRVCKGALYAWVHTPKKHHWRYLGDA